MSYPHFHLVFVNSSLREMGDCNRTYVLVEIAPGSRLEINPTQPNPIFFGLGAPALALTGSIIVTDYCRK
jgi:hypothetical protein